MQRLTGAQAGAALLGERPLDHEPRDAVDRTLLGRGLRGAGLGRPGQVWKEGPEGAGAVHEPAAMAPLAPVLWALLASAQLGASTPAPGVNLSCHRCFKAPGRARCPPSPCRPSDRVCVSHIVVLSVRSRTKLLLSKGCAPRCPNTNSRVQWSAGVFTQGSIWRQCCAASLCNGAAGPRGGPWAQGALLLRVGLGLLWALL
ncbi:Lymphocyte antigen 6L [Galemys pyrenaicus]|uniref:Lymphocyte antigen 6L n=1 Tax=Galemys pyrenaicus TaxID=202257 RepID=A0A8J6A7S1_GALPY|nr:Lymphocyte antigen 6L [Galemys pyrenaicus]